MADHNELGAIGEKIACNFLLEKGYTVLHKNWRHKRDELDLVTRFDDLLVFIEVKTRINSYMGSPVEAVTKGKQQRLIRAAQAYIETYDIDLEVRFDIIGIIKNQQQEEIIHVENAFQPSW